MVKTTNGKKRKRNHSTANLVDHQSNCYRSRKRATNDGRRKKKPCIMSQTYKMLEEKETQHSIEASTMRILLHSLHAAMNAYMPTGVQGKPISSEQYHGLRCCQCYTLAEYLLKKYVVSSDILSELNATWIGRIFVSPFYMHNIYSRTKSTGLMASNSQVKDGRTPLKPENDMNFNSVLDNAICFLVKRTSAYKSNITRIQRSKSSSIRASNGGRSTFLFTNLLSKGYGYAFPDNPVDCSVTTESSTTDEYLPPGMICQNPSTVVSFARSSPLLHQLHRCIGDEALFDILCNCVVFLPLPYVGGLGKTPDEDLARSPVNYIQLCGPPLDAVSLTKVSLSSQNDSSKDDKNASENDNLQHSRSNKQHLKEVTEYRSTKRSKTSHSSERGVRECPEIEHQGALSGPQNQWNPNAPLPRHRIFYCDEYVKNVGLPIYNILNRENLIATDLLQSIFLFRRKGGKKRALWIRLRRAGVNLCERLHKRHLSYNYNRILEKYCSVSIRGSMPNLQGEILEKLVSMNCRIECVSAFVSKVLKDVFPIDFWGSDYNREMFIKGVDEFICMRRHEKFSEKRILHKIRVTDFLWLSKSELKQDVMSSLDHKLVKRKKIRRSASDHLELTRLVHQALRWVYVQYLIPLMRSVFYITETEMMGKRVLYYRKPVWALLKTYSLRNLCADKMYKELRCENDLFERLKNSSFGPSKLRILPKNKTIRPITPMCNLTHIYCVNGMTGLSIKANRALLPTNIILRPILDILQYELQRNPSIAGSGVLGTDKIFPNLIDFKRRLDLARNNHDAPKLYFVSVDIHKCFDNIDASYMLDLVENLLSADSYRTQKISSLYMLRDINRMTRKTKRTVATSNKFTKLENLLGEMAEKFRDAVFIDGGARSNIQKHQIIDLIKEHIISNLVVSDDRFGPRFFLQSRGIPQGSVISTLLCTLYYGDIEEKLLKEVFNNSNERLSSPHLLLRIVDDFLLICTEKDTAERFLKTMTMGMPELGVRIKKSKTLVNYETNIDCRSGKEYKEKEWFPWCGMRFNTKTCHVQIDYSRFYGCSILNSLTVDARGNEGEALMAKMKSSIRPRCIPVLYDLRINDKQTALKNFHHAHLFCALKTAHYLQQLGVSNFHYLMECVNEVVSYSYKLLHLRMKAEQCVRHSRLNEIASKSIMEFIALHAYASVFNKCEGLQDIIRKLQLKCISLSVKHEMPIELVEASFSEFRLNMYEMPKSNFTKLRHSNA